MSPCTQLENVTKATGVLFVTPKVMSYKISKWCHYQSDLENLNSATNDRITFHLCSNTELLSPIILHFTKIKKCYEKFIKSYKKCLLFHLNFFCNIQVLWGKNEFENKIFMTS